MIINGGGEFDLDIIIFKNQFKIEYNQLVETNNVGKFVMVLVG
jgi:hypothetical protein